MAWGISYTCTTPSGIGLELFSSLEFGFPRALHLQCTVELVLQLSKCTMSDPEIFQQVFVVCVLLFPKWKYHTLRKKMLNIYGVFAYNNFWNWIRILFLVRIWFSRCFSSQNYNNFFAILGTNSWCTCHYQNPNNGDIYKLENVHWNFYAKNPAHAFKSTLIQ